MTHDDEPLPAPCICFNDKDAVVEHFKKYNFTDCEGHELTNNIEFLHLVNMAAKDT